MRSTSNTSSRNQSTERNQGKDSNEETNEGNYHSPETEAQDYQEDVDEIFYEANIVQAFSSTTEVPLNEALNGLHAKEWKDAMIEEITNILERNTWKIIDRPVKETIVGSRFVLSNKLNSEGIVKRRKVRLVTRGLIFRSY